MLKRKEVERSSIGAFRTNKVDHARLNCRPNKLIMNHKDYIMVNIYYFL